MVCPSPCAGGHCAAADAGAITRDLFSLLRISVSTQETEWAWSPLLGSLRRSREAAGPQGADGSDAGTGWEAQR